MYLQFNNLSYPPTEAPIGGDTTTDMGKEEMIEFLQDEPVKETIPLGDNKEDKKEEKEEKDGKEESEEKDEEEEDELKEIEEELEGPPEEKLELMIPAKRRDILKKYPTLFKDFPYLENAYYREQQFTEVFPTPADAKAALADREILGNFEKDLSDGKTEDILKAVKREDPKAFNKIVDNYLVTLAKVDPEAQQHVIGNIIKQTVMAMAGEGRRKNNEDLNRAAELIYEFVFGTTDFKPPTTLSRNEPDKESEESVRLRNEREQFTKQRFETANNDLNTRVNNSIKNTINTNIDPKSTMSDYVRRNASRDAMDTLSDLIERDTRFQTLKDRLWEKAYQSNFSQKSIEDIKSAYFSKARTLLPSVIKKARNEALKGMGKRVKSEDDEQDSAPEKESSSNRGKEQSRSPRNSDQKIPDNMSTFDYLNKD